MDLKLRKSTMVKLGFLAALFFYVLMTFPILQHVPVTMDEVLFSEPAKNFVINGHFGTTSMKGLFEFGTKTYWQHPLYLGLMFFPIKLFGYTCWSIKALSAVIGLLSLFVAYKIGSKLGVPYLFPVLLVFNVLFIFLARIGRMEMLTLFLSLTAFYFSWERRPSWAGFFGALSLLNHPIGIFTVINCLLVLRQRRAIDKGFFIALGVPLTVAGAFLFSDMSEFVRQYYTVQHYLYDNSGWLGGPLTQVRNFLKLLIGAKQWLFWLLPLFVLFLFGLLRPQDEVARTIILVQTVSFLGLVSLIPNKYINYYAALVLPYTALYVAYSIKKLRSPAVAGLLVILLITNGVGIVKTYFDYKQRSVNHAILGALIEPNSVVLAQPNLGAYLENCEVVGFHNVRLIMDLENRSASQALQEIDPDYIIIDSNIVSFNDWPLFTVNQEGLGEFVKKHTRFCGKVTIHDQECYVFRVGTLPKEIPCGTIY